MMKLTKTLVLVITTCVVSSAQGRHDPGGDQRAESAWEQATSVSVRLAVHAPLTMREAHDGVFTVVQTSSPYAGMSHALRKQLEPGGTTSVYFPEDLHVRWRPGHFTWECRVGDQVVAEGRFVLTSEHDSEANETTVRIQQ